MAFVELRSGERVTLAELQALNQAERRQRNNLPLEITTDATPTEQTDPQDVRGVPSRGARLAATLAEALQRRQDGALPDPFPQDGALPAPFPQDGGRTATAHHFFQPDSGAEPEAAAAAMAAMAAAEDQRQQAAPTLPPSYEDATASETPATQQVSGAGPSAVPSGWETDTDSMPTVELPAWRARQLRRQGDQGQARAAQARREAHQEREWAARVRREQAACQQRANATSHGTTQPARNRQWREDRQERRRARDYERWNRMQERGAAEARARAQRQQERPSHPTSRPQQPPPTAAATTNRSRSTSIATPEPQATIPTPIHGPTSSTGASEPDRDSGTASGAETSAPRQGQTPEPDKAKPTRIRGIQHSINDLVRFTVALVVATACLTAADLTSGTGILAAAGAYLATADAGHRLNRWALEFLESNSSTKTSEEE